MRLCGNPNSDFDREIKAFRDRLLASNSIGTKLEDVVIASQTNDTMDGRKLFLTTLTVYSNRGYSEKLWVLIENIF